MVPQPYSRKYEPPSVVSWLQLPSALSPLLILLHRVSESSLQHSATNKNKTMKQTMKQTLKKQKMLRKYFPNKKNILCAVGRHHALVVTIGLRTISPRGKDCGRRTPFSEYSDEITLSLLPFCEAAVMTISKK